MSKKKKYNPEKRAWRGKSYKKGGKRVRDLRTRTKPDANEQSPDRYAVEVQYRSKEHEGWRGVLTRMMGEPHHATRYEVQHKFWTSLLWYGFDRDDAQSLSRALFDEIQIERANVKQLGSAQVYWGEPSSRGGNPIADPKKFWNERHALTKEGEGSVFGHPGRMDDPRRAQAPHAPEVYTIVHHAARENPHQRTHIDPAILADIARTRPYADKVVFYVRTPRPGKEDRFEVFHDDGRRTGIVRSDSDAWDAMTDAVLARWPNAVLVPEKYVVRDNPADEPMSWRRASVYGALYVGLGLGVGSIVGAIRAKPCPPPEKATWGDLFCGPGWGAAFGAPVGGLTASAVGGVTALVSEKYRRPGIVAASIGGISVGWLLVMRAVRKNKGST
jgi:hypothetical protein